MTNGNDDTSAASGESKAVAAMTDHSASSSSAPGWRRRRALRRLAVASLCLVVAIWLTWRFFSGPTFLVPRVELRLSELLGGQVNVGSARLSLTGRLSVNDLTLQVPGLDGAAGRFLSIPTTDIELDRQALSRGRFEIVRVTIHDAVLRLSEHVQTRAFNFSKLNFQGRPDSAGSLPEIEIEKATFEVGQHDDQGRFTSSGRLTVRGRLSPTIIGSTVPELADQVWYELLLDETDDGAGAANSDTRAEGTPNEAQAAVPPRLHVTARINETTRELTALISGLSFDRDRSGILPAKARQWWQTINPRGRLLPVRIAVGRDGQYSVSIRMDGVDWTLPVVDMSNPVENLALPRMTGVRGTVILDTAGVHLVGLTGDIDGVTYTVTGDFDSVGSDPGFDLVFSVDEFDLAANLGLMSILPEKVRRWSSAQIDNFSDLGGIVRAQVKLHRESAWTRATPLAEQPQRPVTVSGQLQILDASLTYDRFPYPLTGLDGTIEFTDQEVRIAHLAGAGSNGGTVLLSGLIDQFGVGPRIDLEILGLGIPVDERLRRAVAAHSSAAMERFFSRRAYKALHEAQVFIEDGAEAQALQAQRDRLAVALHRLDKESGGTIERPGPDPPRDGSSRADIVSELDRLDTELSKPRFHLGGSVDLTTRITRQPGPNQRTLTTTRARRSRRSPPIGLIYDRFPYPLFVTDGEIVIDRDEIRIVDQLTIRGPTDAEAWISGRVEKKRVPIRRMAPNLVIQADRVPIDALLLNAIPPSSEQSDAADWPGSVLSDGALMLAGLRIGGLLSVSGTIATLPADGSTDFAINVTLRNGATTAPARSAIANGKGAGDGSQWIWPEGYELANVSADLTVTREGISIQHLSGRHNQEALAASGQLSWNEGESRAEFTVTGRDLLLSDDLLDLAALLVSAERLSKLRLLCERYAPECRFDLDLTSVDLAGVTSVADLRVRPKSLSFVFGENRISFERMTGEIEVRADRIVLHDLDALLADGGPGPPSTVSIQGEVRLAPGSPQISLRGRLREARFESVPIRAALDELTGTAAALAAESFDLAGSFDAEFDYEGGDSLPPRFHARIRPGEISITLNAQRFETSDLRGEILLTDGSISTEGLSGRFQDGEFSVSGGVALKAELSADLALEVSAQSLTPRVSALLPERARKIIDDLHLELGSRFDLRNAHLRIGNWQRYARLDAALPQSPANDATAPATFDFDGELVVRDAALDISLPVTELDGSMTIRIRQSPDNSSSFTDLDLRVDRCRIAGRVLTDFVMRIEQGSDSQEIIIPYARGRSYNGIVSGQGKIYLATADRPGTYEVLLRMAGSEVGPLLAASSTDGRTAGSSNKEASSINGDRMANGSTNDRTPPVSERNRGTAFASLSIAGVLGDSSTRRGRGGIRITDGQLYKVPLAMWILQISSLTLPIASDFDYANVTFFVDGDRVVIDELYLEANSIILVGRGEMDYPTRELDLRFNTYSKLRAPLLTDLWEGVRDALLSIHVTGTLEHPQRNIVPFKRLADSYNKLGARPVVARAAAVPRE